MRIARTWEIEEEEGRASKAEGGWWLSRFSHFFL